nr:restriction endonuclease subunit S [Vibrio sp. 10N.286.48.B7]PMH78509.1 hypothetical protein BCU58_09040 [Vibrio sp. 10N.286.48.B7]
MIFDIEKYSKIPDGWSKVKLSDLADFNAKSWSKKDKPDTINYIDISSVSTGKVAEPTEMKFDSAPSRARRKVDKGDIIISTVRPNLKQFALLDFNKDNLTASTGFCTITPKKPEYTWLIYSVVTTDIFTEHLVRVAQGATYPAIKPSDISEAYIGLPPQEELHKLNALIGALWQKQTINEAMNQTLEKLAQRIFKSWFIDFDPVKANKEGLPFDGLSPEIQALFPSEFEDSELGMIPKGWEVSNIEKYATNVRKNIKKGDIDSDMPYLGLEHINRKCLSVYEHGLGESVTSNKSLFQVNDILLGKLRPYFHKVGIPNFDGVCSTDILVVRPKESFYFEYALNVIYQDRLIDHLTRCSSGTRMPRAKWADVTDYQLATPLDDSIFKAFSKITSPLYQRLLNNCNEVDTLSKLRDRLLPKLISGQISVGEVAQELAEAV